MAGRLRTLYKKVDAALLGEDEDENTRDGNTKDGDAGSEGQGVKYVHMEIPMPGKRRQMISRRSPVTRSSLARRSCHLIPMH